jgi:hypothetical protein
MSSLPQISTELSLAFLLGFIVSSIAVIIQLINSKNSRNQVSQSTIIKVIEIMENTRDYRHELYPQRGNVKPFSQWNDREKKAADMVARAFDVLGVLDNTGNINRKFVNRFYAVAAIELWDICKPFIDEERKKRGPQHLWEFERFVIKIKYVKDNCPAFTGHQRWPLFPRSKYLHF